MPGSRLRWRDGYSVYVCYGIVASYLTVCLQAGHATAFELTAIPANLATRHPVSINGLAFGRPSRNSPKADNIVGVRPNAADLRTELRPEALVGPDDRRTWNG